MLKSTIRTSRKRPSSSIRVMQATIAELQGKVALLETAVREQADTSLAQSERIVELAAPKSDA